MDINRLNEFIVLATHLNYSKAANQLFLTQPALSRHIHDLEDTLGAQLFIRDTHNVHLTAPGKIFFEEAKEIVAHYNRAIELVKDAAASFTGQIRVGFLGAAVSPFLSTFIPVFSQEQPNIKLVFTCDTLDALIEQLNQDKLDICFVTHVDSSFFSGLQSETILNDRLMVTLHPSHELAKRDILSLKDLSGLPCISFSQQLNSITGEFHKQLFKRSNSQYNIVRKTDNMETAFFFVRLQEGYFIIPSHLSFMAEDLSVIPLSDESCNISLNMIWKKNNQNPALDVFRKSFLSYMQDSANKK